MSKETRSPLKGKPLRNPGKSLDEELDVKFYDHALAPLLIALFGVVLAGLEWWRYFVPRPPTPTLYSAVALIAVAYAFFKIWRAWPRLTALRQGRDGEKVVGQFLERLREQGYQVIHDVTGERSTSTTF